MIRTKFATNTISEWLHMIVEFDDKLIEWSNANINATYDMEVFVGESEYYIIVTVDSNEEDNDTSRL